MVKVFLRGLDAGKRSRLQDCSPRRFSFILAILLAARVFAGEHPLTDSFSVPERDRSAAQALAEKLAALSPRVRKEEASRLADCAYATAVHLKRQYGVLWPPLFNNFLVNSRIKKRGLCFQWSEDMLVRFDGLKLTTLEFHWGEANPGTWHENNCVVITAKNQPFRSGIIIDCWRNSGRLYWNTVAADYEPWVENKAYARFIRAKAAVHRHHHTQLSMETEVARTSSD